MTENDEKLLLNEAVIKWGLQAQLSMVQEECGELIVAVGKVLRGDLRPTENFIEEIADVRIMLAQMEVAYGIGRDVEEVRKAKLERLTKRLGIDT